MPSAEDRLRDLMRQLVDCKDDDVAAELAIQLRVEIYDYIQEARGKLGLPTSSRAA